MAQRSLQRASPLPLISTLVFMAICGGLVVVAEALHCRSEQ